MSQLVARYGLLRAARKSDDWPSEVSFWWTPDERIRMHKRGRYHRTDTWFRNLDEAAPVIQKLIDTEAYLEHMSRKTDPYDNALFKGTLDHPDAKVLVPV